MGTSRREFLQFAAAGTAVGLGVSTDSLFGSTPQQDRSLRILVLGGTGFIGPHMVRYAIARGHTITIFNRGKTNTHLFPNVEKLVGDGHVSVLHRVLYEPSGASATQAI